MFSLILCIGTWPGPSIITWHVVLPGDLGELAQRLQLGELRRVVGVGDGAGAQAVAEREGDVVRLHDLADVLEMLVEEALLVVREAPFRHDRAAARDDAGDAVGRQRHIGEPHAGVDGEIVDPLLGLLDQRIAEDLPGQSLPRRRRPSRAPGRSARCRSAPGSCAGSTRACRGCCGRWRGPSPCPRPSGSTTPSCRPRRRRAGDGGVADVGVDLDEEVAADRPSARARGG